MPLTSTGQNARGYEIMDLPFSSNRILAQKVPSVLTVDKEINKAALCSRHDDCKILLLLTLKEKMADAT